MAKSALPQHSHPQLSPSLARIASLFRRPFFKTIHTSSKCANLPLQLADLVLQGTYGLAFIVLGRC